MMVDKIDARQCQDLLNELENHPKMLEQILKYHNIKALKDLPLGEFYTVQKEIRRIKRILNEY